MLRRPREMKEQCILDKFEVGYAQSGFSVE